MRIKINLDISEYKKDTNMYRNLFCNTIQKYLNHKHIYTDTTKIENSVAIAIVTKNSIPSYKISVFTALVIYKAVKYIIKNKDKTNNNYLILS